VIAYSLTGSPFRSPDEQTLSILTQHPITHIRIEGHHHQPTVERVLDKVLVTGVRQSDGSCIHRPMASPIEKGAHPRVHVLIDEKR
jgi:hypothetical protein